MNDDPNASFTFWFLVVIFALIFGVVCAAIAGRKGNGIFGAFLLGALLGPLGLIIVAVLPANTVEMDKQRRGDPALKQCPDCAELVLKEARKCKHCAFMFDQTATDSKSGGGDAGAFDRSIAARRMFKL
jgi:hypothetical protein